MLLDTCALLWLAEGGGRLRRAVMREIERAPRLCVSSVSGLELALKSAHGKLQLPAGVEVWFQSIIDHHSLTALDADLPVCIRAGQLPAIHFDPCDRLIIATALVHKLTVVTADGRFAEYGVETLF